MAPLASFGLRAADPQMPHRHIVSTRRRYMLVAVEVRIYARNAPDWLMATKSLGISVKLEEKNILENVVGLFGAVGFAQPARIVIFFLLPPSVSSGRMSSLQSSYRVVGASGAPVRHVVVAAAAKEPHQGWDAATTASAFTDSPSQGS
uniref:Uncharacterized protein n=1 Tax=Oryza barthii TaxID=65489 RepID=A0A0D3EUT6_9ORYZ